MIINIKARGTKKIQNENKKDCVIKIDFKLLLEEKRTKE
jgi:hypothetical protein